MAHREQPLVVTFGQSEWDLSNREELRRLLEPALTHPTVILDLSEVTFADSTVLQALANLRQDRANRQYAPVSIVAPHPQIRRLFKVVGFDSVWPLYMSLKDAFTDIELGAQLRGAANAD
jgi:anti-anti-sigma factor